MKMKGKIFNAQKVQAMIAGNAVMFREVIKHKDSSRERCPYQVGQKIFCKEKFQTSTFSDADGKFSFYKATTGESHAKTIKWKPAQHMKQEHSRLTLIIKEIKVERLAEISEEDAITEGIPLSNEFKDRYYTPEDNYAVPKIAFMRWWNATHKKPEEKFEANPWVWCITIEVVNAK